MFFWMMIFSNVFAIVRCENVLFHWSSIVFCKFCQDIQMPSSQCNALLGSGVWKVCEGTSRFCNIPFLKLQFSLNSRCRCEAPQHWKRVWLQQVEDQKPQGGRYPSNGSWEHLSLRIQLETLENRVANSNVGLDSQPWLQQVEDQKTVLTATGWRPKDSQSWLQQVEDQSCFS